MESHMDTLHNTKEELLNEQRSWGQRILRVIRMNEVWFFLLLLGVASAFLALFIDESMAYIISTRDAWTSYDIGFFPNYCIWVIIGLILPLISALCVHEVSPHAAGAGVPAMKSILSGLLLHQYLSMRCLLSKVVGLTTAYAGGLSVGKEGPMTHICSMAAFQLAKLPIFKTINKGLKVQMLAAGCAAGVAVTFGAPVGGVLFSIETTSTYYLIDNLWKAFFCAIAGVTFGKVLGGQSVLAMFYTTFEGVPYSLPELFVFCLIGISFGLAGALFVKTVKGILWARKTYKIFDGPYRQTLFVALITALLTFPLAPLRSGQNSILTSMFQNGPMTDWAEPNLFFNLSAFVVAQFIITALSVTLPIPCGVYTPVFSLGAAAGRLLGEVLTVLFPGAGIVPAGYAVVGSVAFGAGVTRTISSAIICFELTGQLNHLIPVFVAVLLATPVGNFFTLSVYDELLSEAGLPFLPAIRRDKTQKYTTEKMMKPISALQTVPAQISYSQLKNILSTSILSTYPLIESTAVPSFLGQVSRELLQSRLAEYEDSNADFINEEDISSASQASSVAERKDIDLIQIVSDQNTPGYDPCPVLVDPSSVIGKIHFMFAVMGLTHAWVVKRGKLVGVLTKKDLMKQCIE